MTSECPGSRWGDFDEGDDENRPPQLQSGKALQQAQSSSWSQHGGSYDELAFATTWD